MINDPFAELKQKQREGWAHFTPVEVHTTRVAAHLVRFATIRPGDAVLDVATGTGVVALTARRAGAGVTALDLTPELLERARENAATAGFDDVSWHQGDVEALPFADASFDVVVSQFGHMFAPRADVAIAEMLRVLRPGGRIAFATWPPEHLIGQIFACVGRRVPAPPGASPPSEWGDPRTIRERLGSAVAPPFFERGVMEFPALSPAHYRSSLERTVGPILKLVQALEAKPDALRALRDELDSLAAPYFSENAVRQDYLFTRATKLRGE